MDIRVFLTVFTTVFIAEIGDKTQIATMLFASNNDVSRFTVFLGSSLALIAASAIGVFFGSVASNYINEKYLHYIAGVGFVLIGAWMICKT